MKEITESLLKACASNLMFEMNELEYKSLKSEFEVVIGQINKISLIEGIDEVIPMTFPFNVTHSYLRDDEPKKTLTREEALKNAKDVLGGQIRLPKVVR